MFTNNLPLSQSSGSVCTAVNVASELEHLPFSVLKTEPVPEVTPEMMFLEPKYG